MKLIKPLLLLLIFQNLAQVACGQLYQQNLTYANYYLNPYLYNPSIIAPSGYTELALNYRQQWSGGVAGAPKTSTLNLQVPLSYKSAIGVNFYNDRAGVLQTNTGLLSFAYQVYLGSSIEDIHKLSFGLSAGATTGSITNTNVGNVSDPTLLASNVTSIDGQFGISYQLHNFKLGFSLPRLFKSATVAEGNYKIAGMDPMRSTIATMSYNFQLSPRLAFEPIAMYRTDVNLHWFEGIGVLKVDKIGWIGGSYRQNVGAAAFIGFNIKERLKVGYAYEFSSGAISGLGNGTHEVQLILRLSKNKKERPQPKPKEEVVKEAVQPEEDTKAESKETAVVEKVSPTEKEPKKTTNPAEVTQSQKEQTPVVQPAQEKNQPLTQEKPKVEVQQPGIEQKAEVKPEAQIKQTAKSLDGNDLIPGHYVVVGAFQSSANARNYASLLKRSGYPADVAFNPEKNYYIVHMGNVSDLEEAKRLRDVYRQKSRYSFKDTWILSIQ